MSERPGGVYARMDARPNTRKSDKVPRKSYVKGAPGPKIHQFEGGNSQVKFEIELSLTPVKEVQLKHNALEAARVAATKVLSEITPNEFFLKIRIFPHHILRENPLATGAGADRFSEGMSRSFGKPIAMSARLKKNQKIMSIRINSNKESLAKEALRRAKMKFPVHCKIIVETLKKEEKVKVVEKEKEVKEEIKEEKVEESSE